MKTKLGAWIEMSIFTLDGMNEQQGRKDGNVMYE